ncbi:MAG TPA: P-type conjugative transfer protein TrbL [Luteibacter sp.]|uniref:P-type conjugative transfer protein TrbL n=1 Tax=Luteibacter sp. TaxID=1886636 RepID=UPI002C55D466|nr:P-type conjugative transfer protein TrbL [Luteibacter sp.]HVI56679.1 P-type conjugative transfer protein TrbL [Luteibacter sp.]
MQFSVRTRFGLGVALALVVSTAWADPVDVRSIVTDVEKEFLSKFFMDDGILDAAKRLFAALATISLVWTMGLQILRQDIGEALMELLRFTIVTGTLYWLLINASSHAGGDDFIRRIVESFYELSSGDTSGASFRTAGDSAITRAMNVYLQVIDDTSSGEDPDRIVGGLMGVVILIALTLLAAQFLLALVMAWFLGYGGIFLLGFGGARWTSQIAINYYKHVVALGIAIVALSVIGTVSENFFGQVSPILGQRTELTYIKLGLILTISILMLVLGLRVPQLLYTLVTGSSLGIFAGTAGMVGSAIAAGGGAAFASATGRSPTSDGVGGPPGGSAGRSNSAMEAIERSAVSASAMADPFHVASGSDPFGVPRGRDAHRSSHGGSVFGAVGGGAGGASAPSVPLPTSRPEPSRVASRSEGSPTPPVATAEGERAASGSNADATARNAASPPATMRMDEGEIPPRPDYLAETAAIAAAQGETRLPSYDAAHHDGHVPDDGNTHQQIHESTAEDHVSTTTSIGTDGAHMGAGAIESQATTFAGIDSDMHAPVPGRETATAVSAGAQDDTHAGSAMHVPGAVAHEGSHADVSVNDALHETSASRTLSDTTDDYRVDSAGSVSTTIHTDSQSFDTSSIDTPESTTLASIPSQDTVPMAPATTQPVTAVGTERRRSIHASADADERHTDTPGSATHAVLHGVGSHAQRAGAEQGLPVPGAVVSQDLAPVADAGANHTPDTAASKEGRAQAQALPAADGSPVDGIAPKVAVAHKGSDADGRVRVTPELAEPPAQTNPVADEIQAQANPVADEIQAQAHPVVADIQVHADTRTPDVERVVVDVRAEHEAGAASSVSRVAGIADASAPAAVERPAGLPADAMPSATADSHDDNDRDPGRDRDEENTP